MNISAILSVGYYNENTSRIIGEFSSFSNVIANISVERLFPWKNTYNKSKEVVFECLTEINSTTKEMGHKREGFIHMYADGQKSANKLILKRMETLEKDWNGYGGEPFSVATIHFCNNIIENLDKQPIISPTGRGTLYMEYRCLNGILGFEVFENKIDMAWVSYQGETIDKTISYDFIEEIEELVRQYYE